MLAEASSPTPVGVSDPNWHAVLPFACAVALAVIHFCWILAHFAPAIMSPDANGYVVQARLIAVEGQTSFTSASPVQYVGMHWLETSHGVFHSRYPAGLPLLFAAAWKLGGLTAALLVNPLLASATVLLVFFLARPMTGGWFALLAAAVVASAPVANQHALDADAHVAATFFLVAGVLALRRFGATRSIWWGLLAGVLLGVLPSIRYPEAISGFAIAGWLAWRVRPVWRAWPAVVGAAVPIGALLAHNTIAYGTFWRTGYALTNEQTGFGLNYFFAHAIPYLQSLGGQGLALFFAFGAAGITALAADRRWRADGLLFAGLVVPLLTLYMAYYFGGPGGGGGGAGNLRFLLPTFPFFAVAGAWLLARLPEHLGRTGRIAVGVVAALQLLIAGAGSQQALARTKSSLTAAAGARAVAEKHVPAGCVLIVDRQLAESLDAVGQWRLVEEMMVAGMGPRLGPGPGGPFMGGPNGVDDETRPSPQQPGKNRAQQERYAGLSAAGRRERVWTDVEEWAGGRPIFWFARGTDAVENALPAGGDFESIAEVDMPAMRGMGGPPSGPAGFGMAGPSRGARGGVPGRGISPMRGGRGGAGAPFPGGRGGPGMLPGGDQPAAKLRLVRITWPEKQS
ncbi:MAG: glycosyltransferase family 39 protein, partial [Opitutaceae bacterium]|nr:glycosyltransferase family 39 protein [Opitutaceae bacterium]